MTDEKSLWAIFYAPDPKDNIALSTRMLTEEELREVVSRHNAVAKKRGNRKITGAIRIPTIGDRIEFEVEK